MVDHLLPSIFCCNHCLTSSSDQPTHLSVNCTLRGNSLRLSIRQRVTRDNPVMFLTSRSLRIRIIEVNLSADQIRRSGNVSGGIRERAVVGQKRKSHRASHGGNLVQRDVISGLGLRSAHRAIRLLKAPLASLPGCRTRVTPESLQMHY